MPQLIPQPSLDTILTPLLPLLHHSPQRRRPFILALTGLQGSGKSTWATSLVSTLSTTHGLHAITVSLDDFYRDHDGLVAVREGNPGNGLLRTRGQPGTHDEELAGRWFGEVRRMGKEGAGEGAREIAIPAFDKSRFEGEGDRVPEAEWRRVKCERPLDVVIFEGWCVGFMALDEEEVKRKWEAARSAGDGPEDDDADLEVYSITTLRRHPLEHVLQINRNLKKYNETFMGPDDLDFLVHLDTDDLRNVYRWRIDQEHALKQAKGSGMTDEGVVAFVQGYMPAYELYLDRLRQGIFPSSGNGKDAPRQMRVVLGRDREIIGVEQVPGRQS